MGQVGQSPLPPRYWRKTFSMKWHFIFADQILKFSYHPGYRDKQCIQAFLTFFSEASNISYFYKNSYTLLNNVFPPIIKTAAYGGFMMLVSKIMKKIYS